MYAFKGFAGRVGPIGVHASMLAIMAGVAWGGLSGWKGSAMAPQGSEFLLADALRPASPLARLPDGEKATSACGVRGTFFPFDDGTHPSICCPGTPATEEGCASQRYRCRIKFPYVGSPNADGPPARLCARR